jgi:hypothetical protein
MNAAERYQIECLGGDYAAGMPALIECITSEEKRFARKLPAGI